MLMLNQSDGAERIFIFIALTALSDTGGYFSGILFGKHKLAPKISPKKSYEGLFGSIFLSGLASILITPLFLDLNIFESIILGLVLPLTGTAGDLFESYVKRNLNIKDFSSLLPGHGGMADRIDSLAFNSLFSYLIFGIFLGF
jgi:phosphatidate cytidylyltransferase